MNEFLKRNWFKATVGILCVGLISVVVYYQIVSYANKLPTAGIAADYQLSNLDGKEVSLKDTDGKARLIYFFYASCPDVCLPTTHMISKVQDGLKQQNLFGSKASIISITFDPKVDTTQNLKEFAAHYKADAAGWDFLRGDEDYTKKLAEKYKVDIIKDKEGNFMHSNSIVLIDGKRNIRKTYSGLELDLEYDTILKDMVQLTKE